MKNAIDMVLLSTALVLVASCGDDAAVTRDAGDPEVPDAASPDAPSDASVSPDASLAECDLRDEVPCPTGYQCMTRTVQLRDWGSDPSMSWETLVCRDVTPVAAEGLPCTFERNELGSGLVEYLDPCEEGTACVDFHEGDGFACVRRCGPDLATCATERVCFADARLVDLAGDRGFCWPTEHVDGCDPVLQTGCASGEVCFPLFDPFDSARGSGRCFTAALPEGFGYEARLGANCDTISCSFGQTCVAGMDGHGTCRRLCDATGAGSSGGAAPDGVAFGACPTSESCVAAYAAFATPAGYCD